jgi:hypothetical protein
MKAKFLLAILIIFLLAACGPIIGSGMVASNGVKNFTVSKGQLSDLKAGSRVLIVAPFATTPESFYICRGEDASVFVDAFNETGIFSADFHMEQRFEDNSGLIKQLKAQKPADIKSKLNLAEAPQYLLTGTILKRETVAAPTKGVLMDVAYRLEFYNLSTAKTTVVEVAVKDFFQQCIRTAVKEIARQLAG